MGVPGLFAFLRRRYPQLLSPAEKQKGGGQDAQQQVDNLYIDMNHIIHSCTHAHVAKDRPEISRTEMFAGMAAYLQQLLDLLEPRRTVVIAIDGVAPRAKMNQQRTRRFLSAYVGGITDKIEIEVRREMAAEAGGDLTIPQAERFDSNIITPGTDFMLQLSAWLQEWAAGIVARDSRFRNTTFIISDASEPGEGEHKIMRFVRHLKLQPGYDPNTTHVVYGQDADLLLLSLLCHEPYFIVMRENMEAGTLQGKDSKDDTAVDEEPLSAVQLVLQRQQARGPPPGFPAGPQQGGTGAAAVAAASHQHLHMPFFEKVDIAVLRECLQWEFAELVGPPGPPGTYGSDQDSDSGAADSTGDSDDEGNSAAVGGGRAAAGARPGSAGKTRVRGQRGLNFEALLDDLVVLSFLAGNDFLPNVPSIDIYDKPCGLDLLFTAYKALLPKMGGHITGGGSINHSRLVQLLLFLARDEEPAYKRRSEYRQRCAAQERDKQAAATADFYSLFDGGLSMGELPPGVDIDKLDTLLQQLGPELAQELGLSDALAANHAAAVDLTSMSPGQLCEELHNRVAARVKERLMGGDPWAQDPVGMHLPGYRDRYYEKRFPELYVQMDGDVDRVAARVSWEYLEGMNWALCYYACGPAALDWRQQQQQQQEQGTASAGAVGASWSYSYSHHYAPLMQDLAKSKLGQKGSSSSSKTAVCVGPISISRSLPDPATCPLDDWAPLGGPVRPLLQLMCVLPAKSVLAALPAALAHLIVLAEAMEEEEQQGQQQQRHNGSLNGRHHQQQQQGHLSKAARKQACKARKASTAARVQGLQGLEVLAALGDDEEAAESADGEEEAIGDPDGSDEHQVSGGDDSSEGAAGGYGHLVVVDDAELSMLRLAKELAATFPSNVEQLVDLTGKKWLHTGIVRLPMAQPQHLAAVLQAVLSLQQQQVQQPWKRMPWQQQQGQGQQQAAAPMGLTGPELSRNTFKPSAVVATAAAATAAGANPPAAAPQHLRLPPGFGGPQSSSSGDSSSNGTSSSVWKLLTQTRAAAAPGSAAAPSDSQTQASEVAAARRLGALGMLLARSGGMHTLSSSTMQHLVPQQQQQQQQQEAVHNASLDLAGLPVPQHDCCLVEGAQPPPLTLTSASWRRTAAGFASSISYAEKVLGIRGSDSSSNGAGGGGGDGGGRGEGDGGRGRGRGFQGGQESARGGRGRGRGQVITRMLFEQHHQEQEEQRRRQEEEYQQRFDQQVAALSAPRDAAAAAPAAAAPAPASAYYYTPDDDGSSNSEYSSSAGYSSAYAAYVNYQGYDNQYTPGGVPRGRGKIGVGNRGRSYRSNNR